MSQVQSNRCRHYKVLKLRKEVITWWNCIWLLLDFATFQNIFWYSCSLSFFPSTLHKCVMHTFDAQPMERTDQLPIQN
jgi:hypothetical protein